MLELKGAWIKVEFEDDYPGGSGHECNGLAQGRLAWNLDRGDKWVEGVVVDGRRIWTHPCESSELSASRVPVSR